MDFAPFFPPCTFDFRNKKWVQRHVLSSGTLIHFGFGILRDEREGAGIGVE